jgi:hypothetical protein
MKEMKNLKEKGAKGVLTIMALFMCVSICLGSLPKKSGEGKSEGSNSGHTETKVQGEQLKEKEDDEYDDELLTDEDRFMATQEGAEANDMMAEQLLNDLIDGGGEYANKAKKILAAENK